MYSIYDVVFWVLIIGMSSFVMGAAWNAWCDESHWKTTAHFWQSRCRELESGDPIFDQTI